MLRLEAELQALSEGRAKVAGGAQSVDDLRHQLGEVGARLRIDLREVQESVVEHSAMYARNPEVLGGMLHVVKCLDLVHAWLAERDARTKEIERQLVALDDRWGECRAWLDDLNREIKDCSERTAVAELTADLARASAAAKPPVEASDVGSSVVLRDLRRENSELLRANADLCAKLQHVVHREASAPASAAAAKHTAHMLAPPAKSAVPAQGVLGLLETLEQLEPMLAALPIGSVPGMLEVQEEACEAYGRLRALLFEAAAAVPDPYAATPPGQGGAVSIPCVGGAAVSAQQCRAMAAQSAPLWVPGPANVGAGGTRAVVAGGIAVGTHASAPWATAGSVSPTVGYIPGRDAYRSASTIGPTGGGSAPGGRSTRLSSSSAAGAGGGVPNPGFGRGNRLS